MLLLTSLLFSLATLAPDSTSLPIVDPGVPVSLAQLQKATSSPSLRPVCVTSGNIYSCSDVLLETPLCFNFRTRDVVPCESLPQDTDGAINRSARVIAAHGIDHVTTAIAINNGASEGNPLIPTVEHRIGAKLLAIAAQITFQEILARKSPKWATRISRGTLVLFIGVGAWNLRQADIARKNALAR